MLWWWALVGKLRETYLFWIGTHDAHALEEIQEQRLGQSLEFKCAVNVLAVYAAIGGDQGVYASRFEAL